MFIFHRLFNFSAVILHEANFRHILHFGSEREKKKEKEKLFFLSNSDFVAHFSKACKNVSCAKKKSKHWIGNCKHGLLSKMYNCDICIHTSVPTNVCM
jgi:hypothetical protein